MILLSQLVEIPQNLKRLAEIKIRLGSKTSDLVQSIVVPVLDQSSIRINAAVKAPDRWNFFYAGCGKTRYFSRTENCFWKVERA